MKPLYILFIGEKMTQLYEVGDAGTTLALTLDSLEEKSKLQNTFQLNPDKKVKILIDNAAIQFSVSPLPKMAIWDRILHLKHKRDLLGEEVIFKDVRAKDGHLLQSYAKPSPWTEAWIKDLNYDSLSFLPLEIKAYGEHLDSTLKHSQWMFLSTLEDGFLRQVIYERGHILSARFTKMPGHLNAFEQQDFIQKDTKQAVAYLNKQGANLPPKMHGFSILPYEMEGFNLKPLESFEDFLKWWAGRPPSLNFQPFNLKAPAPQQIRLGLKITTATLAGLMMLGMAADLYDIYELCQLSKNLEIQKGQLRFTREKLEDEIATYNLPLMKAQLDKYKTVVQETHKPLNYLEETAQVLEKNPDIQILDFQWENDPKNQKVTLKLHVKALEDNDRDVMTSVFQNFSASLASHFGQEHVRVHKAPFNSSDSGIFSGSTRADNEVKDLTEKSGLIEVDWSW